MGDVCVRYDAEATISDAQFALCSSREARIGAVHNGLAPRGAHRERRDRRVGRLSQGAFVARYSCDLDDQLAEVPSL
jgi:hypothetical protein